MRFVIKLLLVFVAGVAIVRTGGRLLTGRPPSWGLSGGLALVFAGAVLVFDIADGW